MFGMPPFPSWYRSVHGKDWLYAEQGREATSPFVYGVFAIETGFGNYRVHRKPVRGFVLSRRDVIGWVWVPVVSDVPLKVRELVGNQLHRCLSHEDCLDTLSIGEACYQVR